jgi:ABC-2 type transport system permease protein
MSKKTRPFYWSLRRELWENRSIYVAPWIAGGVILLGGFISAFRLAELRRNALALEATRQRAAIEAPYDIAALMIMFTAFVVGIFYCLDALHGERRDRSILFWKSLPVSDLTTVLSKLFVPMVIVPLVTFGTVFVTHVCMLLISSIALAPAGLSGTTWAVLPILRVWAILLYAIVTSTIWEAPIFAWLLLVSSWARRATFLWAVMPWLAIAALEKVVFDSAHFAAMLGSRLFGSTEQAFNVVHYPHGAHVPMVDRLSQLDPLRFLSSPGLWLGLVVAAVFLFGAIRMRRSRGPL